MSIVVLGGDGMLGHKMSQLLGGHFGDVYCTIRGTADDAVHKPIELFQSGMVIPRMDALNPTSFLDALRGIRPSVVINCMGILKQRQDIAEDPIHCITVNALIPHLICTAIRPWHGRFITFSSDCVFLGDRGQYTEQDWPDAPSMYGRTKHLGEVTEAENALTLRTSIIGREVKGFLMLLEWFLANDGGKVGGFTKAIWSGVTTNFLTNFVIKIIEEHKDLHGLYHVTAPQITKFDLLCKLRECYGLNVDITPDDRIVLDKIGDRSMLSEKLQAEIGYELPGWDAQLNELVGDTTPYEEWRND